MLLKLAYSTRWEKYNNLITCLEVEWPSQKLTVALYKYGMILEGRSHMAHAANHWSSISPFWGKYSYYHSQEISNFRYFSKNCLSSGKVYKILLFLGYPDFLLSAVISVLQNWQTTIFFRKIFGTMTYEKICVKNLRRNAYKKHMCRLN